MSTPQHSPTWIVSTNLTDRPIDTPWTPRHVALQTNTRTGIAQKQVMYFHVDHADLPAAIQIRTYIRAKHDVAWELASVVNHYDTSINTYEQHAPHDFPFRV